MHTILLVDDELPITVQIREHLLRYGYQVELADTVESALDSVHHAQFDAILVEFSLQSENDRAFRTGNGQRLVRQLRDFSVRAPILMFTVMKGAGYESASRDAGADGFILKPIAISELVVRLDSMIQNYRSKSEITGAT